MTRAPGADVFTTGFVYEQAPQRIVFGWGVLDDVVSEIDRLSADRLLLISERSTKSIADSVARKLDGRISATIAEVHPHVPQEDVEAAREQALERQIDLVVTIGGGSATGLGKAILLEHVVPFVAIPTTYAGSEVTPIYGITEGGRKGTGRDERVLPATVIYDPQLTTSLPARVTAGTGMNAIAHGVEALYAQAPSPLALLLAEEAIRVLRKSLPVCIEDPDNKGARSAALYGAYLAGTVLAGAGMAAHHRICQVLGGSFGLSHGDLNAVVLPHVVAFNGPAAPGPIECVAEALGTENAASGLFDLAVSLGSPMSLREIGLEADELERVASLVVDGDSYNPRPLDRDAILQILREAFEGRRPGDGRDDERDDR